MVAIIIALVTDALIGFIPELCVAHSMEVFCELAVGQDSLALAFAVEQKLRSIETTKKSVLPMLAA